MYLLLAEVPVPSNNYVEQEPVVCFFNQAWFLWEVGKGGVLVGRGKVYNISYT